MVLTSGRLSQYFLMTVILGTVSYWVILALATALNYHQQYRIETIRSSELRAQLAQTQLQALRTQLHPHFLFNTLNAIAELVYQDPPRAERTLTRLSDVLRLSLARSDADLVTLGEELDFLRSYLEVQQILLQERLRVDWTIADETLQARVPTMILQPLVENAIRHGIGPRVAGGHLRLAASRQGGRLLLVVEDDGVGLDGTDQTPGIGLANTRARLQHLYPGNHRFELTGNASGGATATLDLPFSDFAH